MVEPSLKEVVKAMCKAYPGGREAMAGALGMSVTQFNNNLYEKNGCRFAADLAEHKQRLSEELAIAAPKAEFVDRYVKATGSMTFRQVAKLLNAKEPEFAMFLIENGIMYRLNRVLTPKSKHIEAGRFEVKTGTTNQTNYAFNQTTPTT